MIYTDQIGRQVELREFPKRIISLVPSQTELLYHLGIKPMAQTVFCIKPEEEFKGATKIGGTKKLKMDEIRDLRPDLILGNVEENSKEQIEELQREFPVWMSDICTIADAVDMIKSVSAILDRSAKGKTLISDINSRQEQLRKTLGQTHKVLYLIWREPYMAVGRNTYINSMIELMGWENAISDPDGRYPELGIAEISELNPDLILLSSEPFPFKEQHKEELLNLISGSKIILVDGESFSWYGSRIPHAMYYLSELKQTHI